MTNWAWQAHFLLKLWWHNPSVGIYVYCAFMSMVVYDDIVLVRWLLSNAQHKTKAVRIDARERDGQGKSDRSEATLLVGGTPLTDTVLRDKRK